MVELEKKTIAIVSILCLLCGLLGYGTANALFWLKTGRQIHQPPKTKANVFILFETSKGTWGFQSGNVITNIGERYVRNIMGWDNQTANNATQWIALGNSTIAATNTELDSEATTNGLARAANDTCVHWMNGTDYAYNVSNKFTATGNIQFNATSLHWNPTAGSDNNCFALAALGDDYAYENNDNATITWVITFDGN